MASLKQDVSYNVNIKVHDISSVYIGIIFYYFLFVFSEGQLTKLLCFRNYNCFEWFFNV